MRSIIEIRKTDITELSTDAVVNAANECLSAGGGVCGAIFRAAGYDELQKACQAIGRCETGNAVITPGFGCKSKYIIHAVGPVWTGGKNGEPELLRSAYTNALKLAVENKCVSVAFPLISSGIYGYPESEAWTEALSACKSFLDGNKDVQIDVVFAVLSDKSVSEGLRALKSTGASEYAAAGRDDWKHSDMPEKRDVFVLPQKFSEKQMRALRRGNVPQGMEDKWFWYMENGALYAHRSWTGYCIYIVEFQKDGNNRVTVNRDPDEYSCTSVEEDRKTLSKLLDWWSKPEYDHYGQWLSETADMLNKAGIARDRLRINGKELDALFFQSPDGPFGFLSNWYISPFELNGIRFSSAEQFIMYSKCTAFGDADSAKAVLETDDPARQQAIGRKAKGYNGNVWAGMRQMVAYEGLTAKFGQNEELKRKLTDTGDAVLVECSGSDRVWACGIRPDDERRFDASLWDGTNILGFTLMHVRDRLKSGD